MILVSPALVIVSCLSGHFPPHRFSNGHCQLLCVGQLLSWSAQFLQTLSSAHFFDSASLCSGVRFLNFSGSGSHVSLSALGSFFGSLRLSSFFFSLLPVSLSGTSFFLRCRSRAW